MRKLNTGGAFIASLMLITGAANAQLEVLTETLAPAADGLSDITAPLEGQIPTGYFESYNGRWVQSPDGGVASLPVLRLSSGDRTHNVADDYVSVSYFPVRNVQLADLKKLTARIYLPAGSAMPSGSVLMEVLLNSNDPSGPRVRSVLTTGVPNGRWVTVNFGSANKAAWSSNRGDVFDNIGKAHKWAVDDSGASYKVWGIRFQFLGYKGFGPEAWVQNITVNGSQLLIPAQDVGFYSYFDPQEELASLAMPELPQLPATGWGWFQSRNVIWGMPAGHEAELNEALHYSPETRTEEVDFMSISFYPQDAMQIPDLQKLSARILPVGNGCSLNGTPRVQLELKNAAGDQERNVMLDMVSGCPADRWSTVNFLSTNTSKISWSNWGDGELAALQSYSQRNSYHKAAVATLGADYVISTVRLVHENATADMWFDGFTINSNTLDNRWLDWVPTSQFAAPQMPAQ